MGSESSDSEDEISQKDLLKKIIKLERKMRKTNVGANTARDATIADQCLPIVGQEPDAQRSRSQNFTEIIAAREARNLDTPVKIESFKIRRITLSIWTITIREMWLPLNPLLTTLIWLV